MTLEETRALVRQADDHTREVIRSMALLRLDTARHHALSAITLLARAVEALGEMVDEVSR